VRRSCNASVVVGNATLVTLGSNLLGGFVDELVQRLENCRPGLPDAPTQEQTEQFVTELYDAEHARLHEAVQALAPIVDEESLAKEEVELDTLFRRVLLPAFARVASEMTRRERNDFYLTKKGLHGIERVGWTAAGIAVGSFVVWAPFIPIWSKEAVLPFAAAGLLFPELRRFFAYRRYAREINKLVVSVEAEVRRVQAVYLEAPTTMERLDADRTPRLPTGQPEGH